MIIQQMQQYMQFMPSIIAKKPADTKAENTANNKNNANLPVSNDIDNDASEDNLNIVGASLAINEDGKQILIVSSNEKDKNKYFELNKQSMQNIDTIYISGLQSSRLISVHTILRWCIENNHSLKNLIMQDCLISDSTYNIKHVFNNIYNSGLRKLTLQNCTYKINDTEGSITNNDNTFINFIKSFATISKLNKLSIEIISNATIKTNKKIISKDGPIDLGAILNSFMQVIGEENFNEGGSAQDIRKNNTNTSTQNAQNSQYENVPLWAREDRDGIIQYAEHILRKFKNQPTTSHMSGVLQKIKKFLDLCKKHSPDAQRGNSSESSRYLEILKSYVRFPSRAVSIDSDLFAPNANNVMPESLRPKFKKQFFEIIYAEIVEKVVQNLVVITEHNKTILRKLLQNVMDIMFDQNNINNPKILLMGTPGNGKTTILEVFSLCIFAIDVLMYQIGQNSSSRKDVKQFTQEIQKMCSLVATGMNALILHSVKHNTLQVLQEYGLCKLSCFSMTDSKVLQGSQPVYSGSTIGSFCQNYTKSLVQFFTLIERFNKSMKEFRKNVNAKAKDSYDTLITSLDMIYSYLNQDMLLPSTKQFLLDEAEKTPTSSSSGTDIQVLLTGLLERGELFNEFIEDIITGISFIVCSSNGELKQAHLRDRVSVITMPQSTISERIKIAIHRIKLVCSASIMEPNKYNSDCFWLTGVNYIDLLDFKTEIQSFFAKERETEPGSFRKLIGASQEISTAIINYFAAIENTNAKDKLTIDNEFIKKYVPSLLLSGVISSSIQKNNSKANKLMVACPDGSRSAVRPYVLDVAVIRSDQNASENILIQFMLDEKSGTHHTAPSQFLTHLKTYMEKIQERLSDNQYVNSENMRSIISVTSFKDAATRIATFSRRIICALNGDTSKGISSIALHNLVINTLVILLANELGFSLPLNILIIGSSDFYGNISLDKEYDQSLSTRLSSIESLISDDEPIMVLLPFDKLLQDNAETSYVVKNFNGQNVRLYNMNNLIDAIYILKAEYIIKTNDNSITAAMKKSAQEYMKSKLIDHQQIITEYKNTISSQR